jgi:2-methylcitrate dehydratase
MRAHEVKTHPPGRRTPPRGSGVEPTPLAVPNVQPRGARPFRHEDYLRKYTSLAEGIVDPGESERFFNLVRRLQKLTPEEMRALNLQVDPARLGPSARSGIF